MPKRGSEKTYSTLNNAYVLIILIVLMGITILGAIAFPYYISPITYSNGGAPQAGGIAVLAAIIIMGAIAGVYFIENRNYELGGILLIMSLLIVAVYVWVSYGSNAIKFIFNI